MDISSASSAIGSISKNQALVQELSKAVKVDEGTVRIMGGTSWGLGYPMFRTIDAINSHGYTGDAAMALAFYAGKLNGIYFFEPEEVRFYEI